MVVPFAKFTTKKWVVLASKIDQLFIGIGIINREQSLYQSAYIRVYLTLRKLR